MNRAKEHRDALERRIRETFALMENRPRFAAKFKPETTEYVFYVNYMPDLQVFFDRVSIILGDALHNLRSALDYLTFQLAMWNTDGNVRFPHRVQFPIADTRDAFQEAKQKNLREVHVDHIAIIERFQGYHRIHEEVAVGLYFHPLVMLRELSNTDKHRLLTTVMIPSTGVEATIGIAAVPILLFGALQDTFFGLKPVEHKPVTLGTEITRAKLPLGLLEHDVEMAGYVAPQVALPEGRPVVPVIDKIATVAANVIREFETLF